MKTTSQVIDKEIKKMGEIVHYAVTNEQLRPALIAQVIDEDTVTLHVFLLGDDDLAWEKNGSRMFDPSETNVGLALRRNVKRGNEVGMWR